MYKPPFLPHLGQTHEVQEGLGVDDAVVEILLALHGGAPEGGGQLRRVAVFPEQTGEK